MRNITALNKMREQQASALTPLQKRHREIIQSLAALARALAVATQRAELALNIVNMDDPILEHALQDLKTLQDVQEKISKALPAILETCARFKLESESGIVTP